MKAPSVKIPLLSRGKASEPPGIVAVARVDRRTKNITKRLNPGEIAVIDHADLDRVSAEELIRRKVAAVVNASVSITGRYPNLGPQLLIEAGIPVIDGAGQDVLVKITDGSVVRGYHYREDIAALRPYIREYKPVMVAVDGGADALIEAGYQPDAIFGDMDSVSDEALCCGAELVVHAYPDGRAPGLARVRDLGLDAVTLPAPGTSEDVALLVADARGASLIAVVGTHHTLEEFLDKGRPGMSSTFITHLRVGGKLVNARGVHQLYHSRISGWSLLVLVLAAAVTVFVAVVFSPASPILARYFEATWHSFTYWLTGKL